MDQETFGAFHYLLGTHHHVYHLFMRLICRLQQAAAEGSECCQYVCPGLQCFVLGDSQVGKTSLVRSLTGERFFTGQTETQGIEERIVDNEWNTLEFTKGHASGKFIRYFKETLDRAMLLSRDRNEPLPDSTKLDYMTVFTVICLYAGRTNGQLIGILCYALLLMSPFMLFSHLLICTASPFANQLLRSVIYTFVVIHCVSLIRCTLKGCTRLVVIGAFLAVMTTCYSTGVFEIQQFWKIIGYFVVVKDTGLMEFTFSIIEFTVKFFLNHFQGTRPHPGQGKFELGKVRRAVGLLSLMVIGLTGFSITLVLLLLPTAKNNQLDHGLHHMLVCGARCLYIFVHTAESAFVLSDILKVHWSWKALTIVFVTIVIFSVHLILLTTTIYSAATFASLSCSMLLLDCLLMCLHKITLAAADVNYSILQLIDTSTNAFLCGALAYWVKLRLTARLKGKFLNVKVLDFVGDREYYSYHHLLFRHEALYIIVFNLSEFANGDFRNVYAHIQRLQFWMKSICSRVPHYPRILLVGTHRGNVDNNCMKVLNDHLKRFLLEKYRAKLIENDADCLVFFPVENTLGNKDTGIQELQSKIMPVAKEQHKRIIIEHYDYYIPLEWVLMQDAIMKLKINSNATICVRLDEFQRMMDDIVLPSDECSLSKDMLNYFHKIGLIIYVDKKQDFDLSNWILVCHEKLIDIFIEFSSKPAKHTKYRGSKYDWNLLQTKGILTKRLLQSLLSKVEREEGAIIAFLEHYGLICPLENKEAGVKIKHDPDLQPTHFVPSLLPLSADGGRPVWHNSEGDKKLYVFFCNFLPEALFHQLLSRAHKNSAINFPNGKTVLCRNAGKFWMNPWLSYQLILMEEEEMIEVTYNSSDVKAICNVSTQKNHC
ncbi:PREDICTED: uncharacterized protein LOC107357161 isoform X2 [Acropora digitifera]|uniref:uncharacterized protein LOC107357161 isoform X2 n=1 Tax=Acropora digitifera TaxID=70779 RepID=UPI00077AC9AB|nr:PREDICTED: uncharacterized protein LOC107357161 isoform X2 [Acropora digitifera]